MQGGSGRAEGRWARSRGRGQAGGRAFACGDGWIPLDGGRELEALLAAIRAEADCTGRSMDDFDLTVGLGLMEEPTEARIRQVIEMGFGRVLLIIPRRTRDEDWATLEKYAELVGPFR